MSRAFASAFALLALGGGCADPAPPTNLDAGAPAVTASDLGARLEQSRQIWKGMATSAYQYSAIDAFFSGSRWTTVIEVAGGRVVRRSFQSVNTEQNVTEEAWSEDLRTLGSHRSGAPVLTIDELYDRCAREFLTADPAVHEIGVYLHGNGLLQECGVWPRGCQDDCWKGVGMETLTLAR
ncbi:MAG TPA: hypothetical protein VN914_05200 [Polyangia bacterium]|nr:hypothetical protein [Polyangia bacterium]